MPDRTLWIGVAWLALTGLAAASGFYTQSPPRMFYLALPPVLLTLYALTTQTAWIDQIKLRCVTRLHVVRFGVELILWVLYNDGVLPRLMTFQGHNQDILAGASAFFMSWFAFRGGKVNAQVLGLWNLASLLLSLNVIVIALQTQPTILAAWPYIWLPGFILPITIAAHLFVLSRWWRGTLQ
jgi:hypothetical protein